MNRGHILPLIHLLLMLLGSSFHSFAQKYHFINKNVADGLPQSQSTSFLQDEYGQLLIGTYGGLGIYDGVTIKKLDKSNGLLSNYINQTAINSKGDLYIAHLNGLTKIAQHQTYQYEFPEQDQFFNTMLIDLNDQVWLVLKNELFLFKDGALIEFSEVIAHDNTFNSKKDYIISIALTVEGDLLMTTYYQGILKWDGKKLTSILKNDLGLSIIKLIPDSKNDLLYLVDLKNIYTLDGQSKLKKISIPPLKSEEYLNNFYIDSKNNFWMATNLGGVYYKTAHSHWEYLHFEKGFTSEQIHDIYEDNEHTIWLSSNGSGIFSFKNQSVTYYDDYSGFNANIMSIIEDRQKNILLVGNQGLFMLDNHQKIKELFYQNQQIRILDLLSLKNGDIYFATFLHGILKWDGQKLSSSFNRPIGIISSIFEHQAKIFFSSYHQLFHFNKKEIIELDFPFNPTSTISLEEDKILIATLNGLYIFNVDDNTYQKYTEVDNNNILDLDQNKDYLFLGSLEDGLYLLNKHTQEIKLITTEDGLSCNSVYSLLLDQHNQLWIGTGCGLDLIKFKEDQSFSIKKMANYLGLGHIEANSKALFEDHEGKIWIGTNNKLFIYNPQKDQATHEVNNPPLLFESVQLFSKSIWASELNLPAIEHTDLPLNPIFRPQENHLTFHFKAVSLSQANNINYRYQLVGVDKDFTATKQTTVIYPNLSPGSYSFKVWASDLDGDFNHSQPIEFPFIINTPYWKTLYFWIGLLMLSIAITFGIMYYRNKWKQERLIWAQQLREEAQDKVRQSTAEDFHDEIGNKLTRIKLLSSIAKIKVAKENHEAQNILSQIIDNIQQLFTGSKDIIWSLQPESNYLDEVIYKIQQNAEQLVENSTISFLTIQEQLDKSWNILLPMQWGRNILMIFKEALSNAIRHSNAQEITLQIKEDNDSITLELKDNGHGIPLNKEKGNGLKNMQLRAQRIGGTLILESNDEGTKLSLKLWKEKLREN